MPVRKQTKKVHARILMVDDNAHGLTARKTVLEEQGHKVTTAKNGHDALSLFAEQSFDLVITDYKMPKMNGLELIASLRESSPTVRIVLLSGFTETMGLTEQSTGADGVLQKSAHEVPHLIRMVERMMTKAAPTKAAKKRKPASGEAPPPPKVKRHSA